MNKTFNSELLIKSKIWNNDSLELIDFSDYNTEKTEIKVQSSGILSRIGKIITFTKGKKVNKTPFELFSINRNDENGYFYLNCLKPPKELIKILGSNSTYFIFKGNKYKNINNISQKYYKLNQGDIIKLGKIYLKVLVIQIENNQIEDNKYGTEINSLNNSKSSIFRSSSFRSAVVNGQEIIQGIYSPSHRIFENKTMRLMNSLKRNDNINIFAGKHNINFLGKNGNNHIIYKKSISLNKNNKKRDLLYLSINKIRNENKNYFKEKEEKIKLSLFDEKDLMIKEKVKQKPKKNKKARNCRICYGIDFSIENPLICPCTCKGSMKYIHFKCLKNWLNSKIEIDLNINPQIEEEVGITYSAKELYCELCKSKFPDYIKHKGKIYNISFYKPKFKKYIILESIRADKFKTKFFHILSFDNNKCHITLGRSNDCELSIPELSVSRFHCFIHRDKNKLYLEDNNSKFGTCVLLQNSNLLLTDNEPLRIVKGKTYIKLNMLTSSNCLSCCMAKIFDSKFYSYQTQNQKYCDVTSSFVIKEDNLDSSESEDEKEKNNIIFLKENVNLLTGRGDNTKKIKILKR
jgi:pSer/pThr/pTyr-binding forkhead associated (FHA) protein